LAIRSSTSQKKKSKNGARRVSAPRTPIGSGHLPMPRELLSAGVPLDADNEIERQKRLESLKAELTRLVAAGQAASAIDQVLAGMLKLERENERLAWRVLKAERYRFGRSSQRLTPDELAQLYLALGGDPAAVGPGSNADLAVPAPEAPEQGEVDDADAGNDDEEASSTSPLPKKKRKRRRVQRMQASPDIERDEKLVSLSDEERTCELCGREKKVFAHVDHETFVYVPAKIVVKCERREKAGCSHCRQEVSVAPRADVPNVIRKVDASLLAKLIADKTDLALPLERQRRQIANLGLCIPDKTLASYWAYGTDLLKPVALAAFSEVLGDPIVGLDDSYLKTLDKSSKHGVFRGHLWCFVGTDPNRQAADHVAYGYTPSWEADELIDWVSAIDGFMQCDGYAGYASEFEDEETGETRLIVPAERRLGCGMHIRAKFHDALLAKDKRAAIPIRFFAELYKIEAECKEQGLDAQSRADQRRRRSLPILDAFDAWVDQLHPKLLPKSPLRRATTYAINQRPFFRRCFEDGRFEIDNGRVERQIRPFAVGRRNYLFTGSVRGGERLALAYTLVDNCKLLGIDPYRYLVDVINKLEADWPMKRLSDLVPWHWASTQQP
jgi:transposase